ncbi:unnamed protein product [Callosobruchus maculatus]|uniref:Uncharacterized protein n=1 Tax=Callosobruchus maculatus TaxID=64391 RepID=A0A653CNH7_CALMS|nr:unnamed protein product [Callosobruchus maculatus]
MENMKILRKRLRFSERDDIVLLREVLGQNPFENPVSWAIVQENMKSLTRKNFSVRTIKEHLGLIIKLWVKEIDGLKDRSCIEYHPTEKQTLCAEVYNLMKEFKYEAKKTKLNQALDKSKKLGIMAREEAKNSVLQNNIENDYVDHDILVDHTYVGAYIEVNNYDSIADVGSNCSNVPLLEQCEPQSVTTPDVRRTPLFTRKSDVFGCSTRGTNKGQYFALREKELQLEEKKLALEERKLKLAEQQFELASFETRKKLELQEKQINSEIESRRFLETNLDNQNKLIHLLVSKLNN